MTFSAFEENLSGWWQKSNMGDQALSAFKVGLAATLCLWLGHVLGLSRSYWAAVSSIVVMGSNTEITVASCRDRMIGTGIGALLGWGASYAWHDYAVLYGFAVALCVFVCSLLTFEKAGRLAGVTLTIIVLVNPGGNPGQEAVSRFVEVSLGIVVALGVTLLVFPKTGAKT